MTAYLAPDFSIKDIAAFMPSRCSACGTGRRRAGWCWSRGAFEGAVGGGARRRHCLMENLLDASLGLLDHFGPATGIGRVFAVTSREDQLVVFIIH